MLEKLRTKSDSEPPKLPGFSGKEAFSCVRRPLAFIVSVDHDGHIELSLSVIGLKRPTDAHVQAFFRWLGVQPLAEVETHRFTRHFVMPPETVH